MNCFSQNQKSFTSAGLYISFVIPTSGRDLDSLCIRSLPLVGMTTNDKQHMRHITGIKL